MNHFWDKDAEKKPDDESVEDEDEAIRAEAAKKVYMVEEDEAPFMTEDEKETKDKEVLHLIKSKVK